MARPQMTTAFRLLVLTTAACCLLECKKPEKPEQPSAPSPTARETRVTKDPGVEKVRTLGLKIDGHRMVMYARGQVKAVQDGKWVVLASPQVLEEPEYRYFIDADGDLARKPKGLPWSPPAVIARKLALQPLEQYAKTPALAAIRFARLPLDPVTYLESELLEPQRALQAWQAAHELAATTGLAPVIRTFRVQEHSVDGWQQGFARLAEERSSARAFDVTKFFKAREAALNETYAESAREGDGRADELLLQRQALENLPADETNGGEPRPYHVETLGQYVVLVLVSVEPWETLVSLGFGGWNNAPEPVAQSAVLRHWSRLYGAELVVAGGDFLEMRTVRALKPAETKTLAWEQFLFADDVVFQGTETVSGLAKAISSRRWFFWWD